MLDLLRDIVTDTSEPLEEGSQLRQVIINTHSPAVVNSLPLDTLVVARRTKKIGAQGQLHNQVEFSVLPDTWRTNSSEKDEKDRPSIVTMGELLAYLNPIDGLDTAADESTDGAKPSTPTERAAASSKKRLRDYFAMQYELFEQATKTL